LKAIRHVNFENALLLLLFEFQTYVNKDNGFLTLEVCPIENIQKDHFLEVVFPPGYVFGNISSLADMAVSNEDSTSAQDEEISTEENSSDSPDESQFTHVLNNYSHVFHVPDANEIANGSCWFIQAYCLSKVDFEKPSGEKSSFGWVAVHSAFSYKMKSTKHFYL